MRPLILVWLALLLAAPAARAANTPNGPAPTSPAASLKECNDCPEMVLIPAGSFQMGVPLAESKREREDDADARPVHPVRIGQPFYLGKYHVTRGQYAAFAKATGRPIEAPDFDQTDDHPAVNVTWNDAQAYVAWLSRATGKPYRLPTEAEWEYAARAGTTTEHYWGDSAAQLCQYANGDDATTKCDDGYPNTSPVGHFRANPFGLYDMAGNAWQWVQDCYADSGYRGAPSDGSARETRACPSRVVRGGSFGNGPAGLRGGNRGGFDPAARDSGNGFRVARTVAP
jgi:formylglycine-generating enzyme required for sulfatase activity